MDPMTIVTALIAGAAAGGQEAASAAVRDAYLALRNRISGGGGDARAAIEANEAAPGGDIAALDSVVRRSRVVDDAAQRESAERLLSVAPTEYVEYARGHINLSHSQGVQVGHYNTQHNTFG
ncbi:RIP homotypic interaction motif-containing protein [Nocardia carnea]|uniref:RIP homotypic interaction motif-containing protein n=1 Tax=Nocardia carnea TaxID=37328 RepID=UPI0002F5B1E9|nr:RIP homotypic interaction motif-containing protein [Nocardia carnea]